MATEQDSLDIAEDNISTIITTIARTQWEKEVISKLKNPHTIGSYQAQGRALFEQSNAKYQRIVRETFSEPVDSVN